MGLVIAVFIITAVYVGYYASQEAGEEVEAHNISLEPQLKSFENTQIVQNKVVVHTSIS